MGADSLCIKDMAGLLTPYAALADGTGAEGRDKPSYRPAYPLHIRCCCMTYLKAVEAGCGNHRLCAMSPLAQRNQPASLRLWWRPSAHPYDTGYDQSLLAEIADHFQPIREQALRAAF